MDRFRKRYTPIDDQQKALVNQVKDKADELEKVYNEIKAYTTLSNEAGRLVSLALTELESSIHWIVKAATSNLAG